MKLREEYLPHHAMGSYMLIPTGDAAFQGIVRGNETFGLITECLKQDTNEAAITDRLLEVYSGVSREEAARDVRDAVERLRAVGAIED